MGSRYLPLLLLATIASQARGAPPALGDQLSARPLSAARLARSEGDGVLRAVLEAEEPVRRDVLAALRAAPHAEGPEVLVSALCRWAGSRDPHLAPAAGRALLEVVEALDPRQIAAREVPLARLREARKALEELAGHEPAPRPDIVFAARYAEAAFAQLLGQLGSAESK